MEEKELTTARELFGDAGKLIDKIRATAPVKKAKALPLYEVVLEWFKARKFTCFTSVQVVAAFPQRDPDAVHKAIRKLVRMRDLKATGAINWKHWKHTDHPTDHAYLTATLYKG